MQIPVVFENENFIVVDKPAGVLVSPSRQGADDPRPVLPRELARRRGSGASRFWVVHRLDEDVSGLVLLAKNAEAHRVANAWFEQRRIHKTYEAWTTGVAAAAVLPPCGESVLWTCRMARGKKRAYEASHGKESVTRATFAGETHGFCAWRLEPVTGRSHQLRFELARHGWPIVGDVLYGSKAPFAVGAIALRAVRLDLADCPEARALGLPSRIEVPGLSAQGKAAAHG